MAGSPIATMPLVLSIALIVTAVALKFVLRRADSRDPAEQRRLERRYVWPLYTLLAIEVCLLLIR